MTEQHTVTLPTNLIRVPACRQATNYTCGVAALQSIFYYYGEEIRQDDLAEIVKTSPESGTDHFEIIKHAQSQGYNASVENNMTLESLKSHITAGHPVIIALQAWSDPDENGNYNWPNEWDSGHYAVVIGYDDNNIFFMDPSTLGNYAFVPIPEFLERWHDIDFRSEKVIQLGLVIYKDKPIFDPTVALHMQ